MCKNYSASVKLLKADAFELLACESNITSTSFIAICYLSRDMVIGLFLLCINSIELTSSS